MPVVSVGATQEASDRIMVRLAARQHGVVTRRALVDAGVGSGAIKERLESGLLTPIHRGVYAVGSSRPLATTQLMAATLIAGGSSVLSHRSAAYLHGLLSLPGGAIDLSTTSRIRSRRGIRVHYVRTLDATAIDAIPCTTLPRTLIDLAATQPTRTVERALNQAEILRVYDGRAIERALGQPRRGRARLSAILDNHAPGTTLTRNGLEERFLAICRDEELQPDELNAPISLGGGRTAVPDAVWRRERVAVELDGRSVHARQRAFDSDHARDVDLKLEGWLVLRFTPRQLASERGWVVRQLRRALSATRPTPAPSRTPPPCPRAAPRSPGS